MTINTPDSNADMTALRQKLVDELKTKGVINSPLVEAAFRAVPRHLFVPGKPLEQVYSDRVIVTKEIDGMPLSSCEQPAIVAVMLEQLGLEPGQRVLEIGAGTGHTAALIAHIVGESGQVITMDIESDLVSSAREHLVAAGLDRVQVVCADGGYGLPEAAPFDRIILTVGSADITPAWREQLRPGGRLVMPLWLERDGTLQVCVAFEKQDVVLTSISVKRGGFMGLRGAFAAPRRQPAHLGAEPGLEFGRDDYGTVDAEPIFRLLTGPYRDFPTDILVTSRDLVGGLYLWLLPTYELEGCGMQATGAWLERGVVPQLFGVAGKFCSTGGIMEGNDRCVVAMRLPEHTLPAELAWDEPPFPLHFRSFGPDDTLAQKYMGFIKAWDAAGRPDAMRLRIRAVPLGRDYIPAPGEHVLTRPSTRLVLTWDV
jgi:protein-L-isoaspartate(D-aspartate) O-methyltransferase